LTESILIERDKIINSLTLPKLFTKTEVELKPLKEYLKRWEIEFEIPQ
jgi:hypothetical protein